VRSQIQVAEPRRAWSLSYITPSCPAASSRRVTRWAWPFADPRARSQTLEPEISRHEHHYACSWNLATISPTTPAWEASVGKRPSMDWVARDAAAQNPDSRMATSVWQAAANCITSCRGPGGGVLVMVMHSSEPLRLRRVSS
jgi:hypothetical protein